MLRKARLQRAAGKRADDESFNIRVVDIEIASAIDDFSQATKYLQDLADFRPARDVPSHFIREEQWKAARRAQRVELLRGWLKAEKAYEND